MDRIRANLFRRDRVVSGLTTEAVLKNALEANPTNRMAFEMLVVHQLLRRELLPVRNTLAGSPLAREGPLPRHYAEAVLLHRALYPGIPLPNLLPRVPQAIAVDFGRFIKLVPQGPGATPAAEAEARREFGNTYWYYYFFTATPAESAASAPNP